MKEQVRAVKSFVGYDSQGVKYRKSEGDEFELPEGVDWLKKGLVEKTGQGSKKAKKTQERLL